MTKPTGRPRGRPKSKEYVTLMARFPQDLAEQVERYAGRKRQTISEVLRDGVLTLLQDDDDAYRPFVSDRNTTGDILSDTKEEEKEPPDSPSLIMSDMKEALPENMSDTNEEVAPASADIVYDVKKARQRKRAKQDNVSDVNTDNGKVSDRKEGKTAMLSDTKKAPAKKKQVKHPTTAKRAKRS